MKRIVLALTLFLLAVSLFACDTAELNYGDDCLVEYWDEEAREWRLSPAEFTVAAES
jgi:hypothetical protein